MAALNRLQTPWDVDRTIVLEGEHILLLRFSKYEELEPAAWRLQDQRHQSTAAGVGLSSSGDLAAAAGEKRPRGGDALDNAAPAAVQRLSEAERTLRRAHVERCRQMDAVLAEIAPQVRKFCRVYAVDTVDVPEFDRLYELDDPDESFALMLFYRSRHIRVDVGTGNNDKINFNLRGDELIPLIDVAYKAGADGKNLCHSDRKFSNASVRRV